MKRIITTLFCFAILPFYIHGNAISEIDQAPLEKIFFNIFEAGIYDSYLEQVQKFVANRLEKSPLIKASLNSSEQLSGFENEGIMWIQDALNPSFSDPYTKGLFHEYWILRLRSLIDQKDNTVNVNTPLAQEIAAFIDDFTIWMHTDADLNTPIEEFMYSMAGFNPADLEAIYTSYPSNFLTIIHEKFTTDSRFRKKDFEQFFLNNPIIYGDMPSYLFKLHNPKRTKVIRTPNVARDIHLDQNTGKPIKAHLNEEFRNYILARPEKVHLYINVMGREAGKYSKTAEIEKMDQDPKMGSSIIVITMDKSKQTSFYYQKGAYTNRSSAKEFKESFLQNMFKENGDYYWSTKLNLPEWQDQVKQIVDNVHAELFDNQKKLSLHDRLNFIDITYIKIIEALVNQFEPDVMNIACKNTVDRGPSTYALLYVYDRLQAGKATTKIHRKIYVKLFSPPIAMHNRAAHDFRITRFQSTYNHLLKTYGFFP